MTVLVLATATDEHAAAVLGELGRRGHPAQLLDLSVFPQETALTMRYDSCTDCQRRQFGFSGEENTLDLTDVGAIWWRRPQVPQISPAIRRPGHRNFAMNECQEALAGLWYAVDAFWVNDPARDHVAHRKAYQLRVAQDVGVRIPVTLITSDPDAARRFADERGYDNVICKSFAATEEEWRETRLLRAEEIAQLDNVRFAPVIFQEYIKAEYDVRVTVVGDQLFPAAIHSQSTEYPIDFRMDIASAKIEEVALPEEIEHRIQALMRRLGLVYGAIDLRRTPKGDYVFLEINPAGQWLFIEQASGQPIAAALANLLMERDAEREPESSRHAANAATPVSH